MIEFLLSMMVLCMQINDQTNYLTQNHVKNRVLIDLIGIWVIL